MSHRRFTARLLACAVLVTAVTGAASGASAQEEPPVEQTEETVPAAPPGTTPPAPEPEPEPEPPTIPTLLPPDEPPAQEDNFGEEHPDDAPDAAVDVPPPSPGAPAPPLDPAVAMVFNAAAQAAATDLGEAERTVTRTADALRAAEDIEAAALARLSRLQGRHQAAVRELAATETQLRNRAVATYMNAGSGATLDALLSSDDANDAMVRTSLVGSVVGNDQALIDRYTTLRNQLDRELRGAADDLARAQSAVADATVEASNAAEVLASAKFRADLLSAENLTGGDGVVFPVAGPHTFINDWGFARSGGRTHKGTDIFAKHGTPLVAIERGVVYRMTNGNLGGIVLWLKGASGTSYYYAHLAGYANVTVGQMVRPGQLLGYVGNTGNARTTPPHLHLQIHPGGGPPTNPYPLLKAVSDTQAAAARATAEAAGKTLDPTKPRQG